MKKLRSFAGPVSGLLVMLMVLFFTSCSGDGRRPVFPVSGQVMYQGKPTPDALIIFHPVNDPDPNAPHPLTRVNPDGSFALTTYEMNDGAPAGEYIVTITWVKETDNQNAAKEDLRPPKNLVPDRYGKVETSGLRVQVKEEPNKLPPFELTKE